MSRGYPNNGGGGDSNSPRYRSIVSDVFDGKLLSAVQCLICNRVSTRIETFQDLSLPIPSREHLSVLRAQQPPRAMQPISHDSWLWWMVGWLRSWFYGPVVSLQDCLAAFFSADELKGDNMYSCSRCNKLRNGVKMSGVVKLPEVLCVHLKRFRHELMFSSKVGARVSFPIRDLDMAPYTHKECVSTVTRYALCAVVVHAGTAGGGHYTCAAKGARGWHSFDDAAVTRLDPRRLPDLEAYVLFYRKVNPQMTVLRQKAAEILENANMEPNDIKFYISRQWINKFNTWAEPGAIDNTDFVCSHGGIRPDRARHLHAYAAVIPHALWHFLYENFGGGPAATHAHECGACGRAALRVAVRRARELNAFCELHARFQEQEHPPSIYAISMHWFRKWQAFVRNKSTQPPPPVDNTDIVNKQEIEGNTTYSLKQGSDHAQLSEELWHFFIDIYGGGPEVILKSPPNLPTQQTLLVDARDHGDRRPTKTHSDSDREDYCMKSTSETNIRDTIHTEIQRTIGSSLQNINRRHKVSRTSADSDEDVNYYVIQYNNREQNGNCEDSDEEMDVSPPHSYKNTIRMENGLDTSDLDANDNPVSKKTSDVELPNLDSISLKGKPKTGKVRKTKRRTVK